MHDKFSETNRKVLENTQATLLLQCWTGMVHPGHEVQPPVAADSRVTDA